MLIKYTICFFLGYMAFSLTHPPVKTVESIIDQAVTVQEPTLEDLKRADFLKECSKYGFTNTKCEKIWYGEKI